MTQKTKEILRKINQLLYFVEISNIKAIDKLKILKVLLSIKLNLMELLSFEQKEERKGEPRPNRELRNHVTQKHHLILKFIEDKGGRVSAAELNNVGLAGRSLRRYIKDLRNSGKLIVEKKGREHFYLLKI